MGSISLSLDSLAKLRALEYRKSLKKFIYRAWEFVEPSTELIWNWHLDEYCDALEQVHAGHIKRLLINVPPGTMKSMMLVMFNAWEWTLDPSLRYLTFSYSDANTIRDNRRVRDIVSSDWYTTSFGVELSSDQFAKIRFDTTAKGWRIASSVGGKGTGEHPDRLTIDDPIKAADARSLLALDNCINWYKSTVSSRKARDPAIIVPMQRLHMEDLSQYLMDLGGWDVICFPMHYVSEKTDQNDKRPVPDPRDHRTEPGELLWSALYPKDVVDRMIIDMGEYDAAGQLEQNPIPEGGAEFKRTWFTIVDAVPNDLFIVRGYDAGGSEPGSDRSSSTKIGESFSTNDIYILHSVSGNYGDREYDELIMSLAEEDGPGVLIREEREPGSSGKTVITAHARMLRGYDYAGVIVSKDKITRRRPFRAQAQAGNVYVLRGAWNQAYLDAMCSLPFGAHDDEGDSTSCAYNAILAEKRKPKQHVSHKRKERRDAKRKGRR